MLPYPKGRLKPFSRVSDDLFMIYAKLFLFFNKNTMLQTVEI